MTRLPQLLLLLQLLLLPFAAFLAWTIWKLWFRRDQTLDPRVYTVGVQAFGVGSWLVALVFIYFSQREAIPVIVCLIPLWLWAGYFWGRLMMAIFPRRTQK